MKKEKHTNKKAKEALKGKGLAFDAVKRTEKELGDFDIKDIKIEKRK
ncbi:MAG: hypothetical protein ACTSQE_06970 [Candidatus Heimdallarchaeaceae archaeon]